MPRTKSLKILDLSTLPNVIQGECDLKGKWAEKHFGNANPLVTELGCGRGDYTIELARRYPEVNFIGIDIKGARLWRGAKNALENNLTNVVFLRTTIRKLGEYFAADEILEIWLTFPDPYPKRRHESLRLTSPGFLSLYRKILKQRGLIHLKTDDPGLFSYSAEIVKTEGWEILEIIEDIYGNPVNNDILHIQTKYEKQHLANGKIIRYLKFAKK